MVLRTKRLGLTRHIQVLLSAPPTLPTLPTLPLHNLTSQFATAAILSVLMAHLRYILTSPATPSTTMAKVAKKNAICCSPTMKRALPVHTVGWRLDRLVDVWLGCNSLTQANKATNPPRMETKYSTHAAPSSHRAYSGMTEVVLPSCASVPKTLPAKVNVSVRIAVASVMSCFVLSLAKSNAFLA